MQSSSFLCLLSFECAKYPLARTYRQCHQAIRSVSSSNLWQSVYSFGDLPRLLATVEFSKALLRNPEVHVLEAIDLVTSLRSAQLVSVWILRL